MEAYLLQKVVEECFAALCDNATGSAKQCFDVSVSAVVDGSDFNPFAEEVWAEVSLLTTQSGVRGITTTPRRMEKKYIE